MARTCNDIQPLVEGVEHEITYRFQDDDVISKFRRQDNGSSVCRQVFNFLFYQCFKWLTRAWIMHDQTVHLTVPPVLSIRELAAPSVEGWGLTCEDLEPQGAGVEREITYDLGGDRTWTFDSQPRDSSICRELFNFLFYQEFKNNVRVDIDAGKVHLTVPYFLSIGEPEGSMERGRENSGEGARERAAAELRDARERGDREDRKDMEDDEPDAEVEYANDDQEVEVYECQDVARALLLRVVNGFPAAFQSKNMGTGIVILGACHGIMGPFMHINVNDYWSRFGQDADDDDKRLYMASLHLAGMRIPADFLVQFNRLPPVETDTFENEVEGMDALPSTDTGWDDLTDAWTLDWLYGYAQDMTRTGHHVFVAPCIDFLSRHDVQAVMATRLNYSGKKRKSLINEIGRRRIYFLTHAVLTMTAYGRDPGLLAHGQAVATDAALYPRMLGWLQSWHDQLTADDGMIRRECEIVCEIGSCIILMCTYLERDVPVAVIAVARSVLQRNANCPIAEAHASCAYAFHQPGTDTTFEDYHTSLVLAHQACLLARFFANS